MPSNPTPDVTATVKASPTKRFFIAVLIKDIQLIDAVVELVDNSVDGAKAMSSGEDLTGRHIEINFDSSSFSIRDNSGGIPIEIAEKYAFRFGRDDDAPSTPGSVGEFGVGMKRALFKLGKHFIVESKTQTESFTVEVDVDQWQSQEPDTAEWTFPMIQKGSNDNPLDTGTYIKVTQLYPYAIDELASSTFGTRLMASIRQAHEKALGNNLQISVGTTSLHAQISTLLQSAEIQPISITESLEVDGKQIQVSILAGLGERTLADAGWYIYCNGRQIERAEQTERTGWQTAVIEGEKKAPKAHWQFARFRGYLLFESAYPDVLPWNTTKTGLDVEAPAYRRIRGQMSVAMREVITFLNELDQQGKEGAISAAINSAQPVALMNVKGGQNFKYERQVATTRPPRPVRVSFDCDPDKYEEVRINLGATSKKQVGELLFGYYRDAEGLDG
jgi:hypothetical protein